MCDFSCATRSFDLQYPKVFKYYTNDQRVCVCVSSDSSDSLYVKDDEPMKKSCCFIIIVIQCLSRGKPVSGQFISVMKTAIS